ncbi:unnamed protein product [Sphacelaria rigidula]
MRRPQTAGELMQFLQAVNWLRTSLPRLAEVVEPLRVLLKGHMVGNVRRVASNRTIKDAAWTFERAQAWRAAQDLVAHAVALSHPKKGYKVMMFPNASDLHWDTFVTQVPRAELDRNIAVEDMNHEPLRFLSGTFRGAQLRWATVYKEVYAIVSSFRRSEYLLWGGVTIYPDHRNFAYIFDPEACVTTRAKAAAQRLEQWKTVLGQYDYSIRHISGERNCWGDLLSRWVNVPAVSVRAIAIFASGEPDETLPSKAAVREAQEQAREGLGGMVDGAETFTAAVGYVFKDGEGLFRVYVAGRDVLWISPAARELQTRLMVCAHMKGAGLRGVVATTTVKHLLTWCKTLGSPEVWVSDTASHFKNRVMRALEKALKMDRRFAVANSPWSNGTCERMMREIVRTLKAILQEERRDVREWMSLVPAVAVCVKHCFPRAFSTLSSSTGGEWSVDVLDEDALRRQVTSIVEAQQELHKKVAQRVDKNRDLQRRVASKGKLTNFVVGDYVLAARVRCSGPTPKVVSTWTGPWRIVMAEQQHVYEAQNIVNGEVQDVHVARL